MSTQSPSQPPEIPKRSLTPVWLGVASALVLGVIAWWLGATPPPRPEPAVTPVVPAAPAAAAVPTPSAVPLGSEPPPPPPPPREEEPVPPRPAAIPDAPAKASPARRAAPAKRDPNCDAPCKGRESPALLGAMRVKARQARGCYEQALSNDSALAGKLQVSVRVSPTGAACSASVESDSLGDASVTSCVLSHFRSGTYPRPSGGCVNVSVPMNFKPAGPG